MKTRLIILTAFLGLSISCKENEAKQNVEIDTPQEVKQQHEETPDIADQAFIDGMTGKVWHNYLKIKMALVNSDADAANDAANDMATSFDQERTQMKDLALKIAETSDLEEQRKLFSDLTQQMGPMFKEALSGGTIYQQYCPMAFNNEGAYWYSDVSEIRNPYFGDKMLKCGKVTETIEK